MTSTYSLINPNDKSQSVGNFTVDVSLSADGGRMTIKTDPGLMFTYHFDLKTTAKLAYIIVDLYALRRALIHEHEPNTTLYLSYEDGTAVAFILEFKRSNSPLAVSKQAASPKSGDNESDDPATWVVVPGQAHVCSSVHSSEYSSAYASLYDACLYASFYEAREYASLFASLYASLYDASLYASLYEAYLYAYLYASLYEA